jgi:hypothetical protein
LLGKIVAHSKGPGYGWHYTGRLVERDVLGLHVLQNVGLHNVVTFATSSLTTPPIAHAAHP